MKMFCDKCGRKIEEGEQFCIKCGNPLYEEEKKINTETEPEPTEETASVVKKKKRKGAKIIAVIVAFAIVISGIGAMLHTGIYENIISHFAGDSAEKYRNAYNMTEPYMYIARNDKYIFYLKFDEKNGYENIIRMDSDFKNRKTVVEGREIYSIYLSEDSLYFRDSAEDILFCSDFDGNNMHSVVPMEVEWFAIADDSLFFIGRQSKSKFDAEDELALYKSTLDGAEYEKIIEDVSYDSVLSIEDGCIVYRDEDDMICTADTAGENRKSLFKYDGNARDCKIYKNKFYYSVSDSENENLSGIYCVDMTTGEEQKIISMEYGQENFTFWNDSIIYGDGFMDTEIHICALDGSGEKLFCEVPESTIKPFNQPVVMGDYLYYIDLAARVSNINLKTLKVEAFEAVGRYFDITFTDNYIFYINKWDDNIYRCDYDGRNVLKLTDSQCDGLYSYKNKLYYSGYANGYDSDNNKTASGELAHGIFCFDENGEGAYPIVLSEYWLRTYVYDNYLFYQENGSYYRINLDNPRESKEEISSWNAGGVRYKDNFYYLSYEEDDSKIFRSDMNGENETLIFKENVEAFTISNDVVYFIDSDDRNIYRINLDGTVKTKLTDTVCDSIYVHNERVYYTDVYDHGYVYSMNLDGSDKKVIIAENDDYTEKTFYKTEGVDA